MNMRVVLGTIFWMNILHLISSKQEESPSIQKFKASCTETATCPVSYPREELREKLTPMQYKVTQEKGTERAFSGEYNSHNDEGSYRCVVCGNRIFSSDDKYNSRSGWPSFKDVISKEARVEVTCSRCGAHLGHLFTDGPEPTGLRAKRVEVKCADCRSHLGHVFDDGPKPTGVRFCVNSAALKFKKETTV
ncbi:MSRB3-like protein [Mya arenaria]|uniref:Peptide-methionine (R)-S-oxide reductase n=1 Tax=Mya arenaria TaxID=6604 RepID=A0ABY7G165_MYAAR|nr:MSRB3-like protein [Mya arenaria]